jgi:hypothetical protein
LKAHVEIRIRLNLKNGDTLHDVLRLFANQSNGWGFPEKQSTEYQTLHRGPAGFADCISIKGLKRAGVAIANVDEKHPNSFRVTNIVPQECSSLTLEQYNTIGLAFAQAFRGWLKAKRFGGAVEIVGPNKTLADIIPGAKSRKVFEAWLHTPTPLSHPSDLQALNLFICHLFRHPGSVRTYEIESYLTQDRNWKPEAAREAVTRIETGLELLRVDRRF